MRLNPTTRRPWEGDLGLSPWSPSLEDCIYQAIAPNQHLDIDIDIIR